MEEAASETEPLMEATSDMSDHEPRQNHSLVESAPVVPLQSELDVLRTISRRDQQEIEALRGDLLAARDDAGRLSRRLAEAECNLRQARGKVELLERSTSFRFGNALVMSVKSPRTLLDLPRQLWGVARGLGWQPSRAVPVVEPVADTWKKDAPAAGTSPSWEAGGSAEHIGYAAVDLRDLRIAAIMDEFTKACFLPVCRIHPLHCARYEEQLLACRPDLLLVESAWRGEEDSWRHMVADRSGELLGLLDMCRRRNIPTVFWNKEDPSHFDTFIETARLFDHVFTTDIDSIQRYRDALKHDRIHLLPFACQPRIHNPIVSAPRKNGFNFAGSYYRQYPERCEDFDRVVSTISTLAPVVIYDRNSERGEPAFAFPKRYAAMLKPALPYHRIDEAYKGHRFAINMNTIKQSQTMFARRVYELMACNTVVVSNYSRALRSVFGDLVIATDQVSLLEHRLRPVVDEPGSLRRLRLLGLRKVLTEHTYARRVQYMASRVLGVSPSLQSPHIVTVARVDDEHGVLAVLASYRSQHHPDRRLVLIVANGFVLTEQPEDPGIDVIREIDAAEVRPGKDFPHQYLARLHPQDYYGPHYLSDLALATQYSDADCIGKGSHYQVDGNRVVLVGDDRYRPDSRLQQRSSMIRCAALRERNLADWLDGGEPGEDAVVLRGQSIDEFSYCRDGAGRSDLAVDVDGCGIDQGVDLATFLDRAEALVRMKRSVRAPHESDKVNGRHADFRATPGRNKTLVVAETENQLDCPGDDAPRDFFLWVESASRSFREVDSYEVMQGNESDLHDLLFAHSYARICARAPGPALCRVIKAHAASHEIQLRLTDSDLRDAARTPPAWIALLDEGFPRLRVTLDRAGAADVLAQVLGRPLSPGLCGFA